MDNPVVLSADIRKRNHVTQDALGRILYWVHVYKLGMVGALGVQKDRISMSLVVWLE